MKKHLAFTLFMLAACGQEHTLQMAADDESDARVPLVYTVNYPLYWLAQQLAGDAAVVVFPAPNDVDPAFWQPDIATVLEYQQAELILLNGANYARWVASTSLPDSRLVDTSAAYHQQLLPANAGPAHSHGPEGEHSHAELAFTTWLDLELAQRQAQAVAAALQKLLPAESAAIDLRLTVVQKTLHDMDAALSELGKKLNETPLLYSHPVYQYLQQRYQLNGQALHWEPDQEPGEAEWQALSTLLQSHPASLMLWEDQPIPQVAARLNEMGIRVVVFAPVGNRPPQGDFSSVMAANIARLGQP